MEIAGSQIAGSILHLSLNVCGESAHGLAVREETRVVVGDFSGIETGAAMVISATIDAIDALHEAAPAVALCCANDLLHARQEGDFATCLCAMVASSGQNKMANAGHLAPHCNGSGSQSIHERIWV